MNSAGIEAGDLAKRGESLIRKSSNRYLTTVRIAFRAKQRRFDTLMGCEESSVKPVQRAIVELSDEQDQPISCLGDSTGGPGWRPAHDAGRGRFCVLIGGTSWLELTAEEWCCLVGLVGTLEDQHRALVDQLMAEVDQHRGRARTLVGWS